MPVCKKCVSFRWSTALVFTGGVYAQLNAEAGGVSIARERHSGVDLRTVDTSGQCEGVGKGRFLPFSISEPGSAEL